MNDNNMNVWFEKGMTAFVNNDFEDAVKKFSLVIEADRDFRLAFVSRGAAYLLLERVRDAIDDFTRAIDIDPNHAKPYHLRGLAHERNGHPEQALEDMNRAIEVDPQYGAAYLSRSALFSRMGKNEESFEDIQTYTAITEKNLQTFAHENNIWQSRQFRLEEMGAADPMDR